MVEGSYTNQTGDNLERHGELGYEKSSVLKILILVGTRIESDIYHDHYNNTNTPSPPNKVE